MKKFKAGTRHAAGSAVKGMRKAVGAALLVAFLAWIAKYYTLSVDLKPRDAMKDPLRDLTELGR